MWSYGLYFVVAVLNLFVNRKTVKMCCEQENQAKGF